MEVLVLMPFVSSRLERAIPNSLADKITLLKAEEHHRSDIIFLGTSQTNNGFMTEIFEKNFPKPIKAYNLALRSGDYYLFKLFLQYYVQHYGKPKLLLLEVNEVLFNKQQYYFTQFNNLHYREMMTQKPELFSQIFINSPLAIDDKVDIFFSLISGVYRYRGELEIHRVKNIIKGTLPKKPTYHKGWDALLMKPLMSHPSEMKQYIDEQVSLISKQQNQFDSSKLEGLLNYCQQEQIPVVLIRWPVNQQLRISIEKTKLYALYEKRINQVSRKYHLVLIDLYQQNFASPLGLFSDPRHLSPIGAELYTSELAHKIYQLSTPEKPSNAQVTKKY
jgi:hypothetical protein